MKDYQSQSNSPALNKLPTGWSWNPIGNFVTEFTGGCSPTKGDYTKSGFLVLNKGNIKPNGEVHFGSERKFVSNDYASDYPDRKINHSDLVVTLRDLSQKADFLGLIGVYRESEDALLTQGAYLIRCKQGLEPKYLVYFSNSPSYRNHVKRCKHGSTQVHLRNGDFLGIPIPIPPLLEQQRIVAEIEKQFTQLDAGVTALRRVQANLKRYRAAVLKAACEGRLVPTEADLARTEKHKVAFETGVALLARILIARRKSWKSSGKYKEPAAPDTANLTQLPVGWTWTTLDALGEIKGGITKDQNRKHCAPTRSVPYLRVANVQRGYIDLTEVKEVVTTEDEIQALVLKNGDILFNEGGDRDKLGRGWIWNEELPECIHQNHVFRARLFVAELNPKLISWYANTFGQKFFFDEGKHTTNLASISMSKLKGLPVPLPPPAEQTRIVAEVERRLSVVEELEAVASVGLQRVSRLRQSILKMAFTGGLIRNSKPQP